MAWEDSKSRRITLRFTPEDYERMDEKRFRSRETWQSLGERLFVNCWLKDEIEDKNNEKFGEDDYTMEIDRAFALLRAIQVSGVRPFWDAIMENLEAFAACAGIVREKYTDVAEAVSVKLPEDPKELSRYITELAKSAKDAVRSSANARRGDTNTDAAARKREKAG